MRFKIEVRLGNDAMLTEDDVAGVLDGIACKLRDRRIAWSREDSDYPSGPIRDDNGQKVGEWEVTP